MSAPVFLADPEQVAHTAEGDVFTLSGAEGRHAAVVQRRGIGEELHITDGKGTRICGVISAVNGSNITLDVKEVQHENPAEPRVTLVQALVKGGGEDALAFATEAGVDEIIPWQAERSIARWSAEKRTKNRQKWQTIVVQAAKQARRAFIPAVRDVVLSHHLKSEIATLTARGGEVLLAHEDATQTIREIIDCSNLPEQVWLLIGPEGGFTDDEVGSFESAGARKVSIGPHVLRAVHAGGLAVALVRNTA